MHSHIEVLHNLIFLQILRDMRVKTFLKIKIEAICQTRKRQLHIQERRTILFSYPDGNIATPLSG